MKSVKKVVEIEKEHTLVEIGNSQKKIMKHLVTISTFTCVHKSGAMTDC